MPLTNIIDRRKRPYRFAKINVVMEPTVHDCHEPDSDKVPPGYDHIGYDQREHVTLAAAVEWANSFPFAATLYLYDKDGGIYEGAPRGEPIPF
jgi:hypothetical protein